MHAAIKAIDYHLPEHVVSNDDLAREYPDWGIDKIKGKTGISRRHIAGPDECSSDLAALAAQKLLERHPEAREEIDFILLCTQSPDYFLPTTACLLQARLKLPTRVGALDFNLGCSGYVYGLGLAKGLIETGQARQVLLVTAETYSKFIDRGDRNVRTIFGDGAAATLVGSSEDDADEAIGPFVYGTDGNGARNLIVQHGGQRSQDGEKAQPRLHMNGPEIFTFTLRVVPGCLQQLLTKSARSVEEIDLFVFHQANRYMLEHLRDKLHLPPEKFFIDVENHGNTVSASIPIALRQAEVAGRLQSGTRVALVGFGVGYSWGAALVHWH